MLPNSGPNGLPKRTAVTEWQPYPGNGSLPVVGITSNPVKGTVVWDRAFWRRVGDSIEIKWDYEQSAAGSSGSGLYIGLLPNNLKVDTTKLSPLIDTSSEGYNNILGVGFHFNSGGNNTVIPNVVQVGTEIDKRGFGIYIIGVGQWQSGITPDFNNNNPINWSVKVTIPVAGWSAYSN